jgi:hypothetical protein
LVNTKYSVNNKSRFILSGQRREDICRTLNTKRTRADFLHVSRKIYMLTHAGEGVVLEHILCLFRWID